MPFVDVKLSDVELAKPSPIGIGTYTFQLVPGAEYRQNPYSNIEELSVSFSVAEGDHAGRRVFVNYPDPTAVSKNGKSFKWSEQALKKLEISLGEDSLPGEDPAAFLNRVATSAHARISGRMVAETRMNKETGKYEPYVREGEVEPRAVFSIFDVGPAA